MSVEPPTFYNVKKNLKKVADVASRCSAFGMGLVEILTFADNALQLPFWLPLSIASVFIGGFLIVAILPTQITEIKEKLKRFHNQSLSEFEIQELNDITRITNEITTYTQSTQNNSPYVQH